MFATAGAPAAWSAIIQLMPAITPSVVGKIAGLVVLLALGGYLATRTADLLDTKDINVIFVSSKGQKADQVWGRMQGGKGHIVKPATSDKVGDFLKAPA